MTYRENSDLAVAGGYISNCSGENNLETRTRIAAILLLSLLATAPAIADEIRTVDMTQPIIIDGAVVKDIDTHDPGEWKLITEGPKAGERVDLDPACDHCKPLTLGVMLGRTLKSIKREEDAKVTGPMRESWSAFADKIKSDASVKLSPKQLVLLNDRIEVVVPNGTLITLLKKMIDPSYEPKLPE